jgi:hypothetical protein
MNWSAQKPERQAKERSQERVDSWQNVRWPQVKRGYSPTSLDLLSRRIRIQPTTVGSNDLGTAWQNTAPEATGQSLE